MAQRCVAVGGREAGVGDMRRRRRGPGEGTIYKRPDGRWAGQVSLGYDVNGKRIRRSFVRKTRREVADKVAETLHAARATSTQASMALGRGMPEVIRLYTPQLFGDEAALRDWLIKHIKGRWPEIANVYSEVPVSSGGRVDIVAGERFIVECKLQLSTSSISRALGQLAVYCQDYPGHQPVIAGLCDTCELNGTLKEVVLGAGVSIWAVALEQEALQHYQGQAAERLNGLLRKAGCCADDANEDATGRR